MSTILEPTALDVARAIVATDAQTRERIANWYADRNAETLMAMAVTLNESALRLARALLALQSRVEAMAKVCEIAEKLSPRLEPFGGGDWACAECRPESDILVAGFQCHVHALRTALDSYRAKVQR